MAKAERQLTRVEPEGRGSPVEPRGRRYQVELRGQGVKVELMGQGGAGDQKTELQGRANRGGTEESK